MNWVIRKMNGTKMKLNGHHNLRNIWQYDAAEGVFNNNEDTLSERERERERERESSRK